MSISLKINLVGTGTVKTFRFSPEMSVHEVCQQILEKTSEGGADHGLFQAGIEGRTASRWLSPERTLQFYDVSSDSAVDYKKRHRPQKIKLLDETIKTQLIDESTTVSEIVASIAKKMGIKNPEEYSLIKEGASSGDWLKNNQILAEQGILDTDILVFKKKFFFNDANIDRNDPVQLHLLYVQCRDSIIEGMYPTQREESVQLAALQCQVAMGDFNPTKHVHGYLTVKDFVPAQWAKTKTAEKDIYREYRKLVSMSEVNAKYRYVQLCRSLKTYGMTSFAVKMRERKKMIDMTLGITRESMMLMVDETKEVIKSHPLKHIRRWAATEKTFTLDFGDHESEYLIVNHPSPDDIATLISGYIDIIMKSRRDTTKAIDKEENGIATEETVAVRRGQAATSQPFGYGGAGSANHIAPSQQIPITDLKSALRATDMLIGELNAFRGTSAGHAAPQAFSRSFTTLTPAQYKHQLITHSNAISSAANQRAQIIMAELSTVGTCAKNAAFVPELASFSDEIIGVATKISEAMAKLLNTAASVSDKTLDEAGKIAAQHQAYAASALATMMMAACDNMYVTDSSSQLLVECVKSAASASNLLTGLGGETCNLIDDEQLHSQLSSAIQNVNLSADQLVTVTEHISTTSGHPESRKLIDSLCANTLARANSMMTMFKGSGVDTAALHVRMQDVIDTLDMVSCALDCAEQRQAQTVAHADEAAGSLTSDTLTEELSTLSHDLTNSIMMLRSNLNNTPESVLEAFKVIAANSNRMIACTKAVASRSDPSTQARLYAATSAVFESVSVLSSACRTYIKSGMSPSDQAPVIEAAGHVQSQAQQMSVDAGKLASVIALRDCSKDMVAYVAALLASARSSSSQVPDATSLIKASKEVTESLTKLMMGIKRVGGQDAKSERAQMELLELSQRSALPPMTLVATAKRVASKITDANTKQSLVHASDAASQSVQRLMRSCEAYKRVCGHAEIEESLESFDSTLAELETLEIAVQGGFVESLAGQTRESAGEMLMVAVRDLNNCTAELIVDVRSNPARLGELVRAATSTASQVAVGAKALIATTSGKVAQKRLLATAKQLNIDMQQLMRASRSVATNPGDPGADLLLDAAAADVGATVASLVAASSSIDCKELDEAAGEIAGTISTKLGTVAAGAKTNVSNDAAAFQASADELASISKALNAAVVQIVAMARNKNLKGLGAASKITASTINTLVGCANSAAVRAPTQPMNAAILGATSALGTSVGTLLDAAKARVANSKDAIYDQNLAACSKAIETAANKLLRSLGSGATGACDESIDIIIEASRMIDRTVTPQVGQGIVLASGDAPHQQALLALTNAAKALGKATGDVVSSARGTTDALGANALIAANTVATMVASARDVVCTTMSSAPADILIPAKQILDATASIVAASSTQDGIPATINAARIIAASTTQLFNVSKDKVAQLDDESLVKEDIVRTTQQLASATSKLAMAVKSATAKEANAPKQVAEAVRELELATSALLLATADRGDTTLADFDRLLVATRSVATTSAALIGSAAASSARPKDSDASSKLSEAAGTAAGAIKDALKVGASMMPGVLPCEEAIEAVQRCIGDLSTMSLSVAVGTTFEGKAGVSHVESQEHMVDIAKSIGSSINELLKAARQSPDAIGRSARHLGLIAPSLVSATRESLATNADQETQARLVGESKNVGDAMLRLAHASLAASTHPSKETYQAIVAKCSEASDAMNKLVAQISTGVNMYRDLDDALDTIKTASKTLANPAIATGEETRAYQDHKDDITTHTKDLAAALKRILASDQSNLVQLSTVSRDVATFTKELSSAVVAVLATGGEQRVRDAILANARLVVQATAAIVDTARQGGANHDAFRQASDAIARFLQSVKQGAIGEIQSDAAVAAIKKTINDIDSYSLFAAAGELTRDDMSSSQTSAATTQNLLKSMQKEIVTAAKQLIVAGSALVGSSRGSQEHLGAATVRFADMVGSLVTNAKEVAVSLRDPSSQQDILSASKALSIASQQLVLAGKDAQRFKRDSTAFRSLGKAAEAVAEAVGQFISSVYFGISEAGKGIKELDKAAVVIASFVDKPETVITATKPTPLTFVNAVRDVTRASFEVVTSYTSSQDDLVRAAQALTTSVQTLVSQGKGVAPSFTNAADATKLAEGTTSLNRSVINLVAQVRAQDKEDGVPQISEASKALTNKMYALVQLAKTIPGGKDLVLDEDVANDDLELKAENELNALTKSIEAATAQLLASKPKIVKTKAAGVPLDSNDVAGIIVDASSSIATAVAKMVASAAVAQSKRRELAKTNQHLYKQDPAWSNGLISAAKQVGGSVQMMIQAAIKATQGKAEEEELIATAREVAASTARLVSASRAKSGDDANSQTAHHSLTVAAKSVTSAISKLLEAAKTATALQEEEEEAESENFNFTGSKIKELEQQMKILRLEKELEKERKRLLTSRKKEYTDTK
eukprot:gene1416-1640_t